MAVSKSKSQLLWSTAATVALDDATTTTASSDALTVGTDAPFGLLQVKADGDGTGTRADGDILEVYVMHSVGETGGADPEPYDDTTNAEMLGTMDLFAQDPAIGTWLIPLATGLKIYVSYTAGNDAHYDVSASVLEISA